jgi:hypothetical protein
MLRFAALATEGGSVKPKEIAAVFAVCAAALLVGVTAWQLWCAPTPDVLALGSFIALTLTLIVLVRYAYDTQVIATITEERWRREAVLRATYEIQAEPGAGPLRRRAAVARFPGPGEQWVRPMPPWEWRREKDTARPASAFLTFPILFQHRTMVTV